MVEIQDFSVFYCMTSRNREADPEVNEIKFPTDDQDLDSYGFVSDFKKSLDGKYGIRVKRYHSPDYKRGKVHKFETDISTEESSTDTKGKIQNESDSKAAQEGTDSEEEESETDSNNLTKDVDLSEVSDKKLLESLVTGEQFCRCAKHLATKYSEVGSAVNALLIFARFSVPDLEGKYRVAIVQDTTPDDSYEVGDSTIQEATNIIQENPQKSLLYPSSPTVGFGDAELEFKKGEIYQRSRANYWPEMFGFEPNPDPGQELIDSIEKSQTEDPENLSPAEKNILEARKQVTSLSSDATYNEVITDKNNIGGTNAVIEIHGGRRIEGFLLSEILQGKGIHITETEEGERRIVITSNFKIQYNPEDETAPINLLPNVDEYESYEDL